MGLFLLHIKNQKGEQVGLYKGSYALVIGVSDYTNGWPDLPGVNEDLSAVGTAIGTDRIPSLQNYKSKQKTT